MVSLLRDFDSLDNLGSYQKQHLRLDCIFEEALRNSDTNMNSWTWKEYSTEAIYILSDVGFNYLQGEILLSNLSMKYRINEKLPVTFSVTNCEPYIFQIMPELKNKIVRYCKK